MGIPSFLAFKAEGTVRLVFLSCMPTCGKLPFLSSNNGQIPYDLLTPKSEYRTLADIQQSDAPTSDCCSLRDLRGAW
jgi:hypothetical protein